MQSFYSIGGFPNLLGAIDGTQIKIRKPSPEREETFYCRKQYHFEMFNLFTNIICVNDFHKLLCALPEIIP